jgi:hypothetical protein
MLKFIKNCYKTLNEMHNVLTYSKIWKQRLLLSKREMMAFAFLPRERSVERRRVRVSI